MRVVVTGANGFVGRRIVARLAADGHDVVAATRTRLRGDMPATWRQSPDLGPTADWRAVLADADAVVHAAARVHVMDEHTRDPLAAYRRVNVAGTQVLARTAAAMGVSRFVFISSIKVNGERTHAVPFTARDVPAPSDDYGRSKWEAEQALAAIAAETGMIVTAIRPPLVHGAGVKGNMAALARLVTLGWPLPLGRVANRRSLIHVDNLADLVAATLMCPGPLPPVLLARDNESPSTSDLICRLARVSGRPLRLIPVPPRLLAIVAGLVGRSAAADRLLGSLEVDDSMTRAALDWKPPLALDDGLADTMAGTTRR